MMVCKSVQQSALFSSTPLVAFGLATPSTSPTSALSSSLALLPATTTTTTTTTTATSPPTCSSLASPPLGSSSSTCGRGAPLAAAGHADLEHLVVGRASLHALVQAARASIVTTTTTTTTTLLLVGATSSSADGVLWVVLWDLVCWGRLYTLGKSM